MLNQFKKSFLICSFVIFSLSCGESNDFAEAIGISAEVDRISVSNNIISVSEDVRIQIEATTGGFLGRSDFYLFVRFSPQLNLSSQNIRFDITPVDDFDDPFNSGSSSFGTPSTICKGFSNELNDNYVAFFVSSQNFNLANNDKITISFSLIGLDIAEEAVIITTALDDIDTTNCQNFSPEIEEAVSIKIT